MLTRRWRGSPVWGTPASFRLNGVGGLSAPSRDGGSTAGPSTADEGAGMDIRLDSRRPAPELGYRTPATVYGRGKQHKEVEQFLRWVAAPNPMQVPQVMVLAVGLFWLVWLVFFFGWSWFWLVLGWWLVSFWLDLVGWIWLVWLVGRF